MASRFLKIHPSDNVFVALTDLQAGDKIVYQNQSFSLADNVPAKHKFTEKALQPDDEIYMYGIVVGKAIKSITQGGVIGTHNIKHKASPFAGRTKTYSWTPPDVTKFNNKTFMGYHRADGQVGTANYWLVIPLVFCENRNVNVIRQAFEEGLGFSKPEPYKNYLNELVWLYKQGTTDSISNPSLKIEKSNGQKLDCKTTEGVRMMLRVHCCGGV